MNKAAFIPLCCLIFSLFSACHPTQQNFFAKDGILDASEIDLSTEGPIILDGEWKFYWQDFIDPALPENENGLTVWQPGLWNKMDPPYPARGYASYSLKVKTGPGWPEVIAIRTHEISSAFKLYINGDLVSQSGDPGTDDESTSAWILPQTNVYIKGEAETLNIVMHIANFHDREGGRRRAMMIGTSDQIMDIKHRSLASDSLLIGALLLIALYHAILYAYRRKENLPLFFALVCLAFALRTAFDNERIILLLIPFSFDVYGKLWFITYFIMGPGVQFFLQGLFPQEAFKPASFISLFFLTVFSLATLILPLEAGIAILPYYHLVTLAIMLYTLRIVLAAALRRRPGSLTFTIGVSILIITGIHDLLYTEGLIQSVYLTPSGLLFFVFSQAFFIASNYARSLTNIQHLSAQLAAYSSRLESTVKERTEILRQKKEVITHDISSARKVIDASIPSQEQLAVIFPRHFILNQPKDIVGGDFIWIDPKGRPIIALGDCTGHGVPGALLSMLVMTVLSQEAHLLDPENPAHFVSHVHKIIRHSLHQSGKSRGNDDGVDLCLVCFEKNRIRAVGAHAGLYLVSKGKASVLNGDRKGLGYWRTPDDFNFSNMEINIQEDDCLYLLSDGLKDQNGGNRNLPFGNRRLLLLLEELDTMPIEARHQAIITALKAYSAGEPQRDDILVAGIIPSSIINN
ncbi:MAG: hypothetical protein D6B26_07975 [Spirochaetaceae bacterium]|nr:MAG: hypothetical protein D6B26_07975 [Spirochaetaceae bacterium]